MYLFHRWELEVGLYSEWMEGWVQIFHTQSSYNAVFRGRHHRESWIPQHLWLQSSCLVTVCVSAHAAEWSISPANETLINPNTQCTHKYITLSSNDLSLSINYYCFSIWSWSISHNYTFLAHSLIITVEQKQPLTKLNI